MAKGLIKAFGFFLAEHFAEIKGPAKKVNLMATFLALGRDEQVDGDLEMPKRNSNSIKGVLMPQHKIIGLNLTYFQLCTIPYD